MTDAIADSLVDVLLGLLPAPQAILDRRATNLRYWAFINGVRTETLSFDARFNVNDATATARLDLDLPRPSHVTTPGTVVVHGGWDDLVGTLFSGRLPRRSATFGERGGILTLRAVGWSSLLAEPDRIDLVYDGPVTIRDLFVSLCQRKGVPAYRADAVLTPDGMREIALGGNAGVDEGQIVIRSNSSPLSFLNNAVEPFGYRIYDTPSGVVRLSRISGRPVAAPVATFTEGEDIEAIRGDYDTTGIVNYWDVRGPQYEDAFGGLVPIQSIASEIPYDPDLAEIGGYRYRQVNNNLMVTTDLADAHRQVLEIDHGAPDTPVTWDAIGLPGIEPGDVVAIQSPLTETTGRYWLTGLTLVVDDANGLSGTYEGWAGGGEALPDGEERTIILLQTDPIHLGDEFVGWYAVPQPQGSEWSWTFTIPERATAVNIRFLHHGSNSQFLDGVPEDDLSVSRWELWRPGEEKAASSGTIPPVPENYAAQLPYWDGTTHWVPGAVSLRGTDPGTVTIKVLAGENSGAGRDDLEVRDVYVELWGVREPVLPKGGS